MRRAWLLVVALGACTVPEAQLPPGMGKLVTTGLARNLKASSDGAALAYLDNCEKPKTKIAPEDLFLCDLEIISSSGGAAKRVARGVPNLDVGFAWSPDGRGVVAMDGYDLARNAGALVWAPRDGEPKRIGVEVPFYAFSRKGDALGFVDKGQLALFALASQARKDAAGATEVATFEFNPVAGEPGLLAKRKASAGGDLLAVSAAGQSTKVAAQVADYGFSPAGGGYAYLARVGQGYQLHTSPGDASVPNVQSFAYAPDGTALAIMKDPSRDRLTGDLYWLKLAAGAKPTKIASKVGPYRWARGQPAPLAWLEDFSVPPPQGTLGVSTTEGKPVKLGPHVTAFAVSPDGKQVAYLERVTVGGFSVDLKLAPVVGGTAATVAKGVFGFDFSPDGKSLFYRSACVRNAEACDLYRLPVDAPPAPEVEKKPLVKGIKSFEFLDDAGGRLLLTWSRTDLVALDVAIQDGIKATAVDNAVLAGTTAFLGPDKSRLAYIVVHRKRPGVYVAQLPTGK